eukprot:CAMPEP_0177655892 /NCGR_PEP_ID=MMETSP0447-20121125/15237_1 /TAXON_ID=0 /ORGANISM="Stygamoeba regulata, Strain BSH-02190019" /LENGTH=118 /DNA_ID=CAMNT_0019159897 /DNA_START=21 /DNA_END=377 /DNA_ORIENTATION=+
MNHFAAITKTFTKELVFSASCGIQNVTEHGGIKHEAVPLQLNVNTVFFVSGEAGKATDDHSHHHAQWMVVQEGEIEFVSGETKQHMTVGDWVYVPSAVPHHILFVSAAKVMCLHHICA